MVFVFIRMGTLNQNKKKYNQGSTRRFCLALLYKTFTVFVPCNEKATGFAKISFTIQYWQIVKQFKTFGDFIDVIIGSNNPHRCILLIEST